MFEAAPAEIDALPADVRARMRLESGTLAEAAHRHTDCTLAIVELGSSVGPAELDQLPGLRALLTRTTGLDHVDLAECETRGIAVDTVAGYCTVAVAEFALTLIFHLARGRQIAEGLTDSLGAEIAGRTVGVLGGGRIGQGVAEGLRGLGCRVLVYDQRPVEGFEQLGLTKVLAKSSVISLHLPGEAGRVLGLEELRSLPSGSFVVNTARASLVDHDALLEVIEDGHVARAALDVGPWETDPGWLDRPDVVRLRDSGHLVITDHLAWATEEAFARYIEIVANAVRTWSE